MSQLFSTVYYVYIHTYILDILYNVGTYYEVKLCTIIKGTVSPDYIDWPKSGMIGVEPTMDVKKIKNNS